MAGISEVLLAADPGTSAEASTDERRRWNERAALIVFVLAVAVAAYALVFHLGRHFWFNGDEWEFLVDRDAGRLGDLLRPHNEHLTLLPILVYRLLWNVFGLRSYLPYQVPVIALHLTAAVLLRVVMRRSDVNPWIATAAASAFLLFGPGEENVIWAFQITFTGSLVFGLSQLLLADHDGPFGRRDWIALAMGALGLLCSGFTPITAAVVGAVVLVRRGWRPALFQTVPLAVLYTSWWAFVGPDQIRDPYGRSADLGEILRFVGTGVAASFEGLGGSALVGGMFGVVLVGGLLLAWLPLPRGVRLRQAIMPLALFVAGLVFLLISGYGRWWISDDVGSSSRYVHLVAAFTLPALAVAFDALARRWRFGVPVASVVLLVGVPHGIGEFNTVPPFDRAYFDGRRELIAALARSPYLDEVPRSTRPDPLWSGDLDAGWLRDARRDGKLPDLENPADANDPTFRLRFGLAVTDAPVPRKSECSEIRGPTDVSLDAGDELGVKVGPWTEPKDGWFFQQSYTVQLLDDGRPVGTPLLLHPDNGHLLRAQLDDLDVRFGLAAGTEALVLCR